MNPPSIWLSAALITCAACGGTVVASDVGEGASSDGGPDVVAADATMEASHDAGMDVDVQLVCTVTDLFLVQIAIEECSPECCDEGTTACLEIGVDQGGIIVDVQASNQGVPVDLACAQARLLGECNNAFVGETVTLCAAGV